MTRHWWMAVLVAGCGKPPSPSTSTSTSTPHRYIALGDSFTIGTGTTPDRSFPAHLATRWSSTTLQNLGVNGFTTDDLIERELPRVHDFHPDFATLAIGANDIVHGTDAKTYRAHVAQILDALLRELPRCRVLVLPQPDWSRAPTARSFGSPAAFGAQIRAFNTILAEEAKAHGARTLDLFPLMTKQADDKRVADDGLHPSADAYAEWADAIGRALEEAPLAATCP